MLLPSRAAPAELTTKGKKIARTLHEEMGRTFFVKCNISRTTCQDDICPRNFFTSDSVLNALDIHKTTITN